MRNQGFLVDLDLTAMYYTRAISISIPPTKWKKVFLWSPCIIKGKWCWLKYTHVRLVPVFKSGILVESIEYGDLFDIMRATNAV